MSVAIKDLRGALPHRASADGRQTAQSVAELLSFAHSCLGEARPAEAEAAARRATQLAPRQAAGHAMLSLALLDLQRFEAAAGAADAALALSPLQPALLNLAARIAVLRGAHQEALRLIEACLEIRPFDMRALAIRPALLHTLDRLQDEPPLLDYARLIRRIPSLIEGSRSSAEAFNRHVATAIANAPALRPAAPGRTLSGGARLPALHTLPGGLGDRMMRLFEDAVNAYAAALADTPCVVTAARPGRFRLAGWASVMHAGDFERPHIHETGWVSGVYYPEMPSVQSDPDPRAPASIVFGGHDIQNSSMRTPEAFSVTPASGEMLLFPSYFTHRTVPFAGAGRRVSVAFDAYPMP